MNEAAWSGFLKLDTDAQYLLEDQKSCLAIIYREGSTHTFCDPFYCRSSDQAPPSSAFPHKITIKRIPLFMRNIGGLVV